MVVNALGDSGINQDLPTFTEKQSRDKGVFVAAVKVDPTSFIWHGTTISIREAWIEKEVKTNHPLVWFRSLDATGDYFLCLTLDQGRQLFVTHNGEFPRPVFILSDNDEKKEFGGFNENVLFSCRITPDLFSRHYIEVRLMQKLGDSDGQILQFKW